MRDYKPDALWFMTDPRFYTWLWDMDNEIRKNVPMVIIMFGQSFPSIIRTIMSNDLVCTISK